MLGILKKHIKFSAIIQSAPQVLSQRAIELKYVPKYQFTIKKKSSKMWMNEHINDIYVKKAKMVRIQF
jgi:hypothetical protein